MPKGKGYPRSTKSNSPKVSAKSKSNPAKVPAKSKNTQKKGY